MTELLTESFCERCGTRYTFQTAAPKRGRLKGVKTLSKGLRNYVLSDETSFGDAMADARSDEEREASAHQLEAFHQTFNFCLTCRQYTCGNCWNVVENRCLTCAPDLSREVMPAAFPTPIGLEVAAPSTPAAEPTSLDAWPTADLERFSEEAMSDAHAATPVETPQALPAEPDATPAIAAALGATAPRAVEQHEPPAVEAAVDVETEVAAPATEVAAEVPATEVAAEVPATEVAAEVPATEVAAEAPAAAGAATAPQVPDEQTVEGRAAAAAAGTAAFLTRFRPGESLDEAIEAYERETGQQPEAAEREPVAAGPEPVAPAAQPAPVPEPVAAEPIVAEPAPAPEPELAAAATAAEPIAATPARDDIVSAPTWRITAPDAEAEPTAPPTPSREPTTPAWPPLPPGTEVSWPTAPAWPPVPAAPSSAAQDAMWAASSQDIMAAQAPSGVKPCVSCGLSLSSTARFCRRCGSAQG